MFMVLSSWQSHCESSPGLLDECRTAPSGRRPSDQARRLKLWVRLYRLPKSIHPPSPFVNITQPESWYSFYHPTCAMCPNRVNRRGWNIAVSLGCFFSLNVSFVVLTCLFFGVWHQNYREHHSDPWKAHPCIEQHVFSPHWSGADIWCNLCAIWSNQKDN